MPVCIIINKDSISDFNDLLNENVKKLKDIIKNFNKINLIIKVLPDSEFLLNTIEQFI